jgi:anti-sigma factor RsiW
MHACDKSKLSAFLDDELEAAARTRVAEHLRICPHCAAEFEAIQEASQFLNRCEFADLTPTELARVHQVIPRRSMPLPWRLYAGTGLVAASVLIVSAVWLATLPQRPPARAQTQATPAEWELIAMDLRVDPTIPDSQQPRYADARIANWMIESLNGSEP